MLVQQCAKPLQAEPTSQLSANQRPPALHHSTTLCNSPLATADTRASSVKFSVHHRLDSHATEERHYYCYHRHLDQLSVYKYCTYK